MRFTLKAARAAALVVVFAVSTALIGAPPAAAGTTVEGVVRTLSADTVTPGGGPPGQFTGTSDDVVRQVLVVGDRAYRLHGAHPRPNTRVRVVGTISGNDFTATEVTTQGTVAGIPDTGTTRVLVMLAYWTAPDSVTQASAAAQMFDDTNGWYRDASYGALGQTGDVTPWLRIAAPTSGCYANFDTLMAEAKSAASGAGYNTAGYDNYVLYFPYCGGDSAGYAGWAYIGAGGTWLNGYLDRRVTVHEQGHNYGLWHSHSQMCTSGGITGSCAFSDYGDLYDAMGSSGYTGHFNAAQKNDLSWLGGRTVDLSNGGTATIAPMAADAATVHAVLVTASPTRRYWLEYRQPIDFDSGLPSDGTDGVLVHISGDGSGSPDPGPSLIDVRPADGIAASSSTLQSGQSWTSPEGITFRVGTVAAGGATVSVTKPTQNNLFVTKTGTGSGTVTSTPAGISCGSTCAGSFPSTSSVTLTAVPAAGSTFVGWTAGCSGSASTCTIASPSGQTVTAGFATSSAPRYEETSARFDNWSVFTDPTANGGTWRTSPTAGNTAAFRFTGPKVTWVTRKGPNQGKASVTIDGVAKGTFDLYNATGQSFSQAFAGLSTASHTITVKVLGTRNASSTGSGVVVDAFVVGTTTTQESANAVKYDSWKGANSVNASGGAYRSSTTAGATATFAFTGTSVDWITTTGPGWGRAEVYVDGVDKGMVDLYASTARWQTVRTYGGLASGPHTIMIKVLGTKNAAATSTNVAIDAFAPH